MARWLVCVLVFLQVCFLVLSEETTTLSPPPANVSSNIANITVQETTSTTVVEPTRGTSKPTPSPNVVHNNITNSAIPNNANNTTKPDKKNAALSIYSCSQIVMISMLGVLLSASAI